MPSNDHDLRPRVRAILLADWDPNGVANSPAAHATYDAYIDPLLDLIRSGAGEEAVMDFLHDREHEIMCFPGLGKQRLRRVARRLLAVTTST